jgi:outer membrane protein assembly factor BamB
LKEGYVYSAKSSGELVCLDAANGNQIWHTNTVTGLTTGASIHLTRNGDRVFLFTAQGDLILAQLTPQGYDEISRTLLIQPTSPFGTKKFAWTPPSFANRHVFARNDEELICASLAAKP